eukprot:3564306-Lingulodinium_polyedra.AAC.1
MGCATLVALGVVSMPWWPAICMPSATGVAALHLSVVHMVETRMMVHMMIMRMVMTISVEMRMVGNGMVVVLMRLAVIARLSRLQG